MMGPVTGPVMTLLMVGGPLDGEARTLSGGFNGELRCAPPIKDWGGVKCPEIRHVYRVKAVPGSVYWYLVYSHDWWPGFALGDGI